MNLVPRMAKNFLNATLGSSESCATRFNDLFKPQVTDLTKRTDEFTDVEVGFVSFKKSFSPSDQGTPARAALFVGQASRSSTQFLQDDSAVEAMSRFGGAPYDDYKELMALIENVFRDTRELHGFISVYFSDRTDLLHSFPDFRNPYMTFNLYANNFVEALMRRGLITPKLFSSIVVYQVEEMIKSMFSSNEVRGLVCDRDVSDSLPSSKASLNELAHVFVKVLIRYGKLNESFFYDIVADERPLRRREVEAVYTNLNKYFDPKFHMTSQVYGTENTSSNGPAMAKLSDWLRLAFSAGELRTQMRYDYVDVYRLLPDSSNLIELTYKIVTLLEEKNLIDDDFFDKLCALRPRRKNEIDAIRNLF